MKLLSKADLEALVQAGVEVERAACIHVCVMLAVAHESAAMCVTALRARSLTTPSTTGTLSPHETPTTE